MCSTVAMVTVGQLKPVKTVFISRHMYSEMTVWVEIFQKELEFMKLWVGKILYRWSRNHQLSYFLVTKIHYAG